MNEDREAEENINGIAGIAAVVTLFATIAGAVAYHIWEHWSCP